MNLAYTLRDGRVTIVTPRGSVMAVTLPHPTGTDEAIAQLPAGRTCLTPDERRAYDLAPLSDAQWRQRGCEQFAGKSRSTRR
jgi:hypothetical protein